MEIEEGLDTEGNVYADEVERILYDRRGWTGSAGAAFRRVDSRGAADLRVILASPDETDRLCAPLRTRGLFSCRVGEMVVLNAFRWNRAAEPYENDLFEYRRHVVNHEVGHRLASATATARARAARRP